MPESPATDWNNVPDSQKAIEKVCAEKGRDHRPQPQSVWAETRGKSRHRGAVEKAGADLVSLSERLDTTSAAGKMQFRLLAAVGRVRTRPDFRTDENGDAHAKRQGRRVGTIPFGGTSTMTKST
jgi:hypothetical protein